MRSTLEVHAQREGEPYFMGFFLVGAYQEILGDMHNLFGDTNTVHVDLDEGGRPRLSHVIRGDRVREVLAYVDYAEADLLRQVRGHVEDALRAGRLTYEESARLWERYETALSGYTYLAPGRSMGEQLAESERSERTEALDLNPTTPPPPTHAEDDTRIPSQS